LHLIVIRIFFIYKIDRIILISQIKRFTVLLKFLHLIQFLRVDIILLLYLLYKSIFFFSQILMQTLLIFVLNVLIFVILIWFVVCYTCNKLFLNFNIWVWASTAIKKLIDLHLMLDYLIWLSNLYLSMSVFLRLFDLLTIISIIVDFMDFFDFTFVIYHLLLLLNLCWIQLDLIKFVRTFNLRFLFGMLI